LEQLLFDRISTPFQRLDLLSQAGWHLSCFAREGGQVRQSPG
jgi:hypothetical protein